ncbi:MAG: hypothetical protein EBV82_09875, partial [Chitinophagia bacterium]|nr:hypothetical protein [Chitinophagia bacterium]
MHMWRLTIQFLKRFLDLNFSRFFLALFLSSLLLPAYALDSIWYSDKDLKEGNIQLIPEGYIDPSSSDPCAQKTYDKPLSLVDVTEAALCHNPQTKEVYASAKAQAAQVGVARSLFFPSVTDTVSTSENKTRSTNYSNVTNKIVASYLLYDFGSRDATLENANQLLKAASATQNATVQNVLLNAVNAFYQVHANKAILNASIETEHLYQESFKSAEAKYIAGVVEAEAGRKSHSEFYKAQSILARTYALSIIGKHVSEGHDLCDQVHCQAFFGRTSNFQILEAVNNTKGLVVVDQDLN